MYVFTGGDMATQCELLTAEQMIDRAADLMAEARKSVTFMETSVWVNQSDMAISCYLLPDSVTKLVPTVRLPCLTDMVTQAVTGVLHTLSLDSLIHPTRVNMLLAGIIRCSLDKLNAFQSRYKMSPAKFVNWIHSTGLLDELESQLVSKLEEAKDCVIHELEAVQPTADERLLEPEEDEADISTSIEEDELKRVETILNRRQLRDAVFSIQFSSVLQDIPVKPESREADIIEEPAAAAAAVREVDTNNEDDDDADTKYVIVLYSLLHSVINHNNSISISISIICQSVKLSMHV